MKPLIVLLAALSGLSCARERAKAEPRPATPVNTAAVKLFTPGDGERYSATLAPFSTVSVSFRVNGTVDSIAQSRGADGRMRELQPGDDVREGAELARVGQKNYQLQVDQASSQVAEARSSREAALSQLAQAEAQAAKASKDMERARFLLQNTSITRPDFDAAQAQFDGSRAQVDAARAQVQAITARVATGEAAAGATALTRDETVLRAPVGGVIVQRNIEKGGVAGPAAPAFSIADVSSVKALVGVPDSTVATIKTGAHLALEVEAFPEQHFEGIITSVAPVADSGTHLFQVEVTVPNQRRMLRPGMIATLFLSAGASRRSVPVVPLAAIVRSPQNVSAFAVMVVEGNAAHRRTVSLGETYGDKIGIASGLSPGEVVISRGAGGIEDGEAVVVIP